MEGRAAKGFTIIEVVLVLAIAGLIFLMVFLALPALQRNQRDTQRRSDAAQLLAAIQQYKANNQNAIPFTPHAVSGYAPNTTFCSAGSDNSYTCATGGSTPTAFYTGYLNGELKDPRTGNAYRLIWVGTAPPATATPNAPGEMAIRQGYECSNGDATVANSAKLSVVVDLEGGPSFCQDI